MPKRLSQWKNSTLKEGNDLQASRISVIQIRERMVHAKKFVLSLVKYAEIQLAGSDFKVTRVGKVSANRSKRPL